MNGPQIAKDIEARAKAAGVRIDDLCKRAGVARSTFQRMKAGVSASRIDTITTLLDVVAKAEKAA